MSVLQVGKPGLGKTRLFVQSHTARERPSQTLTQVLWLGVYWTIPEKVGDLPKVI